MFDKLKEEIIERFDEKVTAQYQKIVDLEEKIALQEKKIENLSIKNVTTMSNTVDATDFECAV